MDHLEQARRRVYWQYRGSPKLRAWLEILPAIAQTEIEDPAQVVADLLDLDNRFGEQLDIIGRIVGLDRPPVIRQAESSITALGAEEPQLGETGAQLSAAQYTIQEELSDSIYRVLIKARIEKNNGPATVDNIVRALRYISQVNEITVNDNEDMTFSVSFGAELSSTVRFALNNFDILPRPQGVRFLGFIESPTLTQMDADFAQLGDERAQLNEVFT